MSSLKNADVLGHSKQICERADLDKEVDVQGRIFRSTLCGDTAPLTFTPDKIAATTMSPTDFSTIVRELATRIPPPPLPRVAKALDMLREIGVQAVARGLGIHIFVMELLKGETLRTILAKSIFSVSQQQKRDACNNVAISVIMTFLKSLYWSRDQHADNAMISGPNTFTLDHGLMYHLLNDEVYIKALLARLLASTSITPNVVCNYFGVSAPAAAASVAFNELYDMLRNPNLKGQMLISTAAVTPAAIAAEIDRISEIVFRMLSFFLLVDGLSNRYKHGTHHFQSREYMEIVFDSVPALYGFEEFLKLGSINLSVFGGPPGSIVHQNMAYIVQGLQSALAICQGQGPPRTEDQILFNQFSTSPGQIRHDAAKAARQAAAARQAEEEARQAAARQAEEEARQAAARQAAAVRRSELERKAAEERAAEESDAMDHHARSSKPPLPPKATINSRRRSRSPPPKADAAEAAAVAPLVNAQRDPGRLSGLTSRLTKWFSGRGDHPKLPNPPDDDLLDGGTVKRRFRAQKRQKQTMRPCNIRRRQRRRSFNKR
jgi:hypothetical protein